MPYFLSLFKDFLKKITANIIEIIKYAKNIDKHKSILLLLPFSTFFKRSTLALKGITLHKTLKKPPIKSLEKYIPLVKATS